MALPLPENNYLEEFCDPTRSTALLESLSLIYRAENFTDFSISVGNEEIKCHKLILAVSSPYFVGMFKSNLEENRSSVMEIKNIRPVTMRLVLDYLYTGKVCLTVDTVQDVLSAANLFQLVVLREGCADYMIQHTNLSNCVGIYFFAKAHQCHNLAAVAKGVIFRKFVQLIPEQEFLELPADQLEEILIDDNINVNGEELIFEAALAWVNHDLASRQQHFVRIINCVRFANLSCYYFCDKVMKNPLIKDSVELKPLIEKVGYYHMLRHRHLEMDLNLLPRAGMSHVRGVVIMANPYCDDAEEKYSIMQLLIPKTGTIHYICRLPQGFYMPGCTVTGDNCIYLAGGELRKYNYRSSVSSEGYSRLVFMFDDSLMWQPKASMLSQRSHFQLVLVDGTVYAIGGRSGCGVLSSVERYCSHSNSWEEVSPLPKALCSYSAVSYRGTLYLFGGETETEITSSAYKYDRTTDTWTTLPNMKVARALAGSVVHQNKIYLIGGNSSMSPRWRKESLPEHCVNTVEIFDPESEIWHPGPELPNALCGAGVVKFGETILTVGGEDDKSWLGGLYWLQKRKGTTNEMYWREGAELTNVMSTFACVIANLPSHIIKR